MGNKFQDWPNPPGQPYWPQGPISWPTISGSGWQGVPHKLNAAFSPNPQKPAFDQSPSGSFINVQHFASRNNLKRFVEFLEYKALEYYVFGKMNTLVPEKTFFGFRPKSLSAKSDCDIDVAVCLGYQFIAVSCTEATERGIIKSKGFEAWHRARQIGGDGARAVVVCPAADSPCSTARAGDLENDLADDVGLRDPAGNRLLPVRFFGFNRMRGGSLDRELETYLKQDLNWG